MKKLYFLFFILIIPFLIKGQCDSINLGDLGANVYEDSVVLNNKQAYRNCGSMYTMEISEISPNMLKWAQVDEGGVANCECYFDLSVTLNSLQAGDYTVQVYYYDVVFGDTCYIGDIEFTYTGTNGKEVPEIIGQYQSPCYLMNVSNENEEKTFLTLYPNPASQQLNFSTSLSGEKEVSISNLQNKNVMRFQSSNSEETIDIRHLASGTYLISVSNGERKIAKKFVVR